MALQHLQKSDLKNARQTCRTLDEAAVPLLFDTVYVATNHADMNSAGLLCARFGPFVHNIIYSSMFYKREDFYDFLHGNFADFKVPDSANNDEYNKIRFENLEQSEQRDMHQLWALYCELANEHEAIVMSGEFQSQLCRLLRALPKLCRITIDDCIRSHKQCFCDQALFDAYNRQHDPLPKTAKSLNVVKCKDEHICYEPVSSLMSAYKNPMNNILNALATTQVSVEEISVELRKPEGPEVNGLSMIGIILPSQCLKYLSGIMLGLTRLILRLESPYERHYTPMKLPRSPTILSTAINLRLLQIEIVDLENYSWHADYDIKPNIFGALMGTRTLPKLESFSLNNIDGTEAEILRFLRGSSKLKELALKLVYLTSGTWAHLLEGLRTSLDLETVEIEEVSGRPGAYFGGLEPFSDGPYDWAPTVTSFFFEDGPNPFLEETWQESDPQGDDSFLFRSSTSR